MKTYNYSTTEQINSLPYQTPATKYKERHIESFTVNTPYEKIDLHKWITEMNDMDYKSYSTAHKAVGSFFIDNKFFMTNVENVGTETLIQNYELRSSSPSSIKLYSPKTKAYIFRWFPVTVGVPWEIYVEPVSSSTSRLTCVIGVNYPHLLLRLAAWFISLGGLFLKKHLHKEGKAFAKDVEEKFKS